MSLWRQHQVWSTIASGIGTKSFRSRSIHRRHNSVHIDQAAFSCDVCSRPFNRKDNFLSHRKRMHPNALPEVPPAPEPEPQSPSDENSLTQPGAESLDQMQKSGVPCLCCNRQFASKFSRARHMKIHSQLKSRIPIVSDPYRTSTSSFSKGFNLYEPRPPGVKEVYLIQPALPEMKEVKKKTERVAERYFCWQCDAKFRSAVMHLCHSRVAHSRSGLIVYDIY